jgi:hypothetical protein
METNEKGDELRSWNHFSLISINIRLLRSRLEFGHLEPRSGKRILAWRVSARLIVTEC